MADVGALLGFSVVGLGAKPVPAPPPLLSCAGRSLGPQPWADCASVQGVSGLRAFSLNPANPLISLMDF